MRCQPGLKNEVRANFSLGFARSCVPSGRRFLSLPAICAQAVLLVIQKEAPSNDLGGKDSQSRKQRKCGCTFQRHMDARKIEPLLDCRDGYNFRKFPPIGSARSPSLLASLLLFVEGIHG